MHTEFWWGTWRKELLGRPGCSRVNNIKMYLIVIEWGCGTDSSESRWLMTGSREYCNEPSGPIEHWESLGQLMDYTLLQKNSARWSSLGVLEQIACDRCCFHSSLGTHAIHFSVSNVLLSVVFNSMATRYSSPFTKAYHLRIKQSFLSDLPNEILCSFLICPIRAIYSSVSSLLWLLVDLTKVS